MWIRNGDKKYLNRHHEPKRAWGPRLMETLRSSRRETTEEFVQFSIGLLSAIPKAVADDERISFYKFNIEL